MGTGQGTGQGTEMEAQNGTKPPLDTNDEPMLPKALVGARHIVTFMLFLGMANAYVMRTNMSVAIVAMVNHSALPVSETLVDDECPGTYNSSSSASADGEFVWTTVEQSYILSSFFYGYVLTQIPFGILTKKYGAKYFLGIGMLINSVFGLLVPVAARTGYWWLILVRFIQGLGETYGIVVHTCPTPVFFGSIVFAWNGLSLLQGPIVPCTHALLAKWIPPNERSRMGAFVYAGAQFGTVVSMPLSGLLAALEFDGGWPLVFYVFGAVGTIWSIAYFFTVFEDPENHPSIAEDEKKYIISSVWGSAGVTSPPVPWKSIVRSLPFWAILIAHMGQNYGYETLMTELPTFMKQVLYFDIKSNGTVSALPYLAMWLFSMLVSHIADWMITSGRFTHTITRKVLNSIGQFGPALCLAIASYTGCNKWLTVGVIVVGVGLNGGIYSGFKVNHLDISPRFAGILMSFTNCLANLAGLLAPMTAGYIIEGKPTQAQWRIVFMICVAVYVVCSTFYLIFASGQRQPWDNPDIVDDKSQKKDVECAQQTTALNDTQH